jgi:hypothetical protein
MSKRPRGEKLRKIVVLDRDYSTAEKEIAELRRTGKLNDSTINRFAVTQEIDKLTVALAHQIRQLRTVAIQQRRSGPIGDRLQSIRDTLDDYSLDPEKSGRLRAA